MTAYNRAPLPAGETQRISAVHRNVDAALVAGPKTNVDLSAIALDYTRGIRAMRMAGKRVDCEYLKGGMRRYSIVNEPEPQWKIPVEVTLFDGRVFMTDVLCGGPKAGVAKNRAQHIFAKTKLGEPERVL